MKNRDNRGMKRLNWTAFILLVALILRIPGLTDSFWLDEAAQAIESARPLSQQLMIKDDFQPPLLHLLLHFVMYLGKAEWLLRSGVSLIPSLIVIYLILKSGEELKSKWAGIVAGLWLATSSFAIFYAQELRPYALPAMWAALSWWILVRKEPKRRWLWFSLSTVAGLYSSYLYPFALLGQLIWSWFELKLQRRNLMVSFCAIVLGFLPWLPKFQEQLGAGQQLRVDLPGWEKVVSFTQAKSLALTVGKFWFGVLDLEPNLGFAVVALLLVVGLMGCLWFTFQAHKFDRKWLVVLCWGVIPILAVWVVSFVVPVLQPKRVLFAFPAFALAIGWLLELAWQKRDAVSWAKYLTGGTAGLILCINLFGTFQYFTQPKYRREDWRGIVAQLQQQYGDSQVVVIQAFPAPFASWQWYNQDVIPTVATSVLTTNSLDKEELRQRLKPLMTARYIIVFDYLRDLTDPERRVDQVLQAFGLQEVATITPDTPLGQLHIYALPGVNVSKVPQEYAYRH